MQLKKIYDIANQLAPFSLSSEYCLKYGAYDNSGIQLDCGGDIPKVLFSLDLSYAAIEAAKAQGVKLIFTHHPAIFSPIKHLTGEECGEILTCAQAHISVISAHLNLDVAPGGIDESLMQGLGGKKAAAFFEPVDGGAYGRVFERETTLSALVREAGGTFQTEKILVYDGGREIKRIASFCGAGLSEESVAFARRQGAELIVSSDAKHHLLKEALSAGISVMLLTHYAAENYGFCRFYEKFREKSGVSSVYFTDERYL